MGFPPGKSAPRAPRPAPAPWADALAFLAVISHKNQWVLPPSQAVSPPHDPEEHPNCPSPSFAHHCSDLDAWRFSLAFCRRAAPAEITPHYFNSCLPAMSSRSQQNAVGHPRTSRPRGWARSQFRGCTAPSCHWGTGGMEVGGGPTGVTVLCPAGT